MRKKIIALLSISLLLTGCGNTELMRAYDYTDNNYKYNISENTVTKLSTANNFSSDLCVPSLDRNDVDENLVADSACIFSIDDNQVIFTKNPYERLYPASITKVMTAIVVLKYANLTDTVTVGDEVNITESGAKLCGFNSGDTLTVEQLLNCLMVYSGNDAGAALAVYISGSVEQFAELMNSEAKKLGATGTNFVNPHGLHDDNHYTTAYDLYLMFNEAIKNETFINIISQSSYTADYITAGGYNTSKTFANTNKYLNNEISAPENVIVTGGKTGTTDQAGNCLILLSTYNDKKYVSVVLKSNGTYPLYEDMNTLLEKIAQ